jgi:hypothetical protein
MPITVKKLGTHTIEYYIPTKGYLFLFLCHKGTIMSKNLGKALEMGNRSDRVKDNTRGREGGMENKKMLLISVMKKKSKKN